MKLLHLLYVIDEPWPTFRPDITALFGKYLPRHGIASDIVTDGVRHADGAGAWQGGEALLRRSSTGRAARHVVKLWHNVVAMVRCNRNRYDAIQVRDMPLTAAIGLAVARWKGMPFFYWMSFPQSEGQVMRARARGPRAGLRYWFPVIQGTVGQWLLYRLVLPHADHLFVQSEQMALDLARRGLPTARMTPVPMGVDLELAHAQNIAASDDTRLQDKLVLVYLGTLDRARSIEVLFQMLARVVATIPAAVLVLAGDTEDATHRAWLHAEASRAGVTESVIWTGWQPASVALRYVRSALIGLSPFPRGPLLDSASPTKAIALGLPVVVNDNPDQRQVVEEAGCGLCVALSADSFAQAVSALLADPARRAAMGAAGQRYITQNRGYDTLARRLATSYREFFAQRGGHRTTGPNQRASANAGGHSTVDGAKGPSSTVD
jgi:glycosyltransferase involved in cell wall biosynthesis